MLRRSKQLRQKKTGIGRSENMRRIRGKDTTPEMVVRQQLHRLGFRYRLHVKSLPGQPDLVFPKRRKIIFVHGCFWHSHGCRLSHSPKTNRAYWSPKLERNIERDARNLERLKREGWACLVIWECEVHSNDAALTKELIRFLEQ